MRYFLNTRDPDGAQAYDDYEGALNAVASDTGPVIDKCR